MKRKVFEVEGVWHQIGSSECCGAKSCWCGGKIHWQGEFKKCDHCGGVLPRMHSTDKMLAQLNKVGQAR
jgi:hypothetical protein